MSSSSGALTFNTLRGEVEVGNKLQVVTRSTAARAAPDFDRVLLVSLWTPINVYGRLYRLSQSLFATDIIYRYLALAPVPYLSHAFSVFQFIWSSVQQAQSSKQQLECLSHNQPHSFFSCSMGRMVQSHWWMSRLNTSHRSNSVRDPYLTLELE